MIEGDIMAATIITGVVSIICTVLTVWAGLRKSAVSAQTAQAVTDEKISELTREVRKHNNFAERVPILEEKIKVMNHRIEDLERSDK